MEARSLCGRFSWWKHRLVSRRKLLAETVAAGLFVACLMGMAAIVILKGMGALSEHSNPIFVPIGMLASTWLRRRWVKRRARIEFEQLEKRVLLGHAVRWRTVRPGSPRWWQ